MDYLYITVDRWVHDITEAILYFFKSAVYTAVFSRLNWIQKYYFSFFGKERLSVLVFSPKEEKIDNIRIFNIINYI